MMNTEKVKASAEPTKTAAKPANAKGNSPASASAASPMGKLPPLFRKFDWLAMLIAFGVVWVIYFLTLAPQVTLEDSGELCTGSFYAGIPHPPGYPFWALYSWLWTLLPFGNVAWRVELGEATAAALGCGLVGLMVSRGSSMLMEGLEVLKDLGKKWENVICLVCGVTSGVLMGVGYTMWSESVAINRISLFGMPWVMVVMVCIMRWLYTPKQWRYLFCAMFVFGLCATIHQTLIVAAMGIEAAIIYAHPRLGRTLLCGNSIVFLAGWIADATQLTAALQSAETLRIIFFAVGWASIAGYAYMALKTKETIDEFITDAGMAGFLIFFTLFAATKNGFYVFLAMVSAGAFVYGLWKTYKLGLEWLVAITCLFLWICGVMFYFYEPLSGMTNPPMEWGYPRTVEGFFHALERGQYEKVNPTDVLHDPMRFVMQLGLLASGIVEEFNPILFCVAIIPFLFFLKLQRRERSWLACLAGIYFCIGIILVILMNPSEDRASVNLHRVFFASSHGIIAILFGMGLALTAAYMATNYKRFRQWGLMGGGIAAVLGLYSLYDGTRKHFFGLEGDMSPFDLPHWIMRAFAPHQGGLPVFGHLILAALPFVFLLALWFYKDRAPLAITLAVFAVMPISSALSNWGKSEQRNHWFGYWFGHDMFTPPFTDPQTKQLSYDNAKRADLLKNPTWAKDIYPEMARNAILFGGTDPGRFCPTYMIFCESFIPHNCQPEQDQHFDRRDVYIITQNALADPTYLDYIRAQYFRSAEIDPPFFQQLLRSEAEKSNNYTTNFVASTAYKLLDVPFTKYGANVEKRRRMEGVYPPKEIYTPSMEDQQRAFSEYMADAQQRLQHDLQYPNAPKLIKPGEDVHQTPDGRVSIAGQIAVMSINGLLTKVIFDHNPNNEFYVEESFPLDWMYPYLSPFGDIMKLNREPIKEMPQEMIDKDHTFWSRYGVRTVGDWITYDTTVKEIGAWAKKVYLEHDYSNFKGDMRFIRDDQAQQAFSKLRSSVAGIYDWRFLHPANGADQQRMLKEADFAYRQAFAMCPFSPEVVSRYVNLLMRMNRVDDAIIIVETCSELDPRNQWLSATLRQLNGIKSQMSTNPQAQQQMPSANPEQLEQEYRANTNNFQTGVNVAIAYIQSGQADKGEKIFDELLNNPKADAPLVTFICKTYAQMSKADKLKQALEKLTTIEPASPEVWCDLAALDAATGKFDESIKALQVSMQNNSKRLAANPKASNLAMVIKSDARFNALRNRPDYQKLMAGQ